ncbi:MAG: hypothetical protein RSA91_06975 [Bacilli bacterium]
MNDFLRTILPLIAMFLGILAITRGFFSNLENKVFKLEEEIKKLNKKINEI